MGPTNKWSLCIRIRAISSATLATLFQLGGGRTISETFPTSAIDGCWFPTSAIPKVVTIVSKSVTVGSTARYTDSVGPRIDAVTYYRQHGRAPCSITIQQVLVIDCPNPPANPTYFTNNLTDAIGPVLLAITRGNEPSVTEAFGAPAPALTLPAILLNLLFPPH